MSDFEQFAKYGAHLIKKAKECGWKDDGEGAYEFIVRTAYEAGMEEGKPTHPASTHETEWQPIETAPQNGMRVLLFNPPYGAGCGFYQGDKWKCNFVLHTDNQPTHWMPLPEPPK